MTASRIHRRRICLIALGLLVGAIGCGEQRYAVSGKVAFADGTPLDAGTVMGETTLADGKKTMVQSSIGSDGSFSLGTEKPGDGVPPGKYKLLVAPRAMSEMEERTMPPFIDRKWERFESSGLELDVTASKTDFNITVTKPKGR
jgi:hypothetical protein